ncbi:hypothetical protein ACZ90_44350 [Streptomyces albus subsp. albus]|nr:hypothetical protein ACZ90_44350 [Streptomyces albus subsp. albus]
MDYRLAGPGKLLRVAALAAVTVALLAAAILLPLLWDGGKPVAHGQDADRSVAIPCAEAMEFAGGTLPKSATDGSCRRAEALDISVDGTFRMPRAQVRPWLAGLLPGQLDHSGGSCGADLCARYAPGPHQGHATYVDIAVHYQGEDTALVRLHAYTT